MIRDCTEVERKSLDEAMNPVDQMAMYNGMALKFKDEMLRVLSANADVKGGHRGCNAAFLVCKLLEEAGEVAKLLRRSMDFRTGRLEPVSPQKARRVLRECADVANIAMMLADLARREPLERRLRCVSQSGKRRHG